MRGFRHAWSLPRLARRVWAILSTEGAGSGLSARRVARLAVTALRRPRIAVAMLRQPAPGSPPSPRQGEGKRARRRRATVVVPVHNAHDDVERCLEALVRNTIGAAKLLVIDDASPDPRIGELLDRYRGLPDVEILRNEENLGYTRTVNRGVDHARGDVVLLNSDTEVTPRWLQRLAEAAYAEEGIGTITAVSNNAGAFSVPDIAMNNPVPDGYSKDSVGRLVAQASERLRPPTPTGNGFCLYVKHAVFEDIGLFDAKSFPRGYGEENDFCVRALKRGWRHAIDDATFIFHAREASFGAEKSAIVPGARARVSELHPEYDGLVRDFLASKDMKRVRARVRETFDSAGADHPLPRILFVVHEGSGGVVGTSRDLLDGLRSSYDCLLLSSNTQRLKLWRGGRRGLDPVQSWRLSRAWHPTDFRREDYGAIAREILTHWEIELVHVHHLFKHSFDVPRVAAELEIPVVVSFHDHYLSCPTVHLLDERDRFCGGLCSPGSGRCRIPARQLEDLPPLKHNWVYRWRSEVAGMLETSSAVVTTSPHTREVYRRSLPSLRDKRFEIIPHGRNLEQAGGPAAPPAGDGPVRILVPGNLAVHKGADYIRALRAEDRAERLEFHFLGDVPDEFADLGVQHGEYVRDEFGARLREIAPSFVGLFSITAETYNHSLTEAWAAGVPVLATAIGALAERVGAHGGGFLLPVDDPKAAYARITEIVDDPEEYGREAERATAEDLPNVAAMARAYEALYESVRAGNLSFSPRARERIPPRRRAGRMELAAFVPGEGGQYTGSTHVRVVRRLLHPTVATGLDATLVTPELPARLPASADLALVQRTGVAAEAASDFVADVRRAGIPLVFELDDDLLSDYFAEVDAYAPDRSSITLLLEAADLVTVSTEVLRHAIADRARRVVVVPNMLDERLWLDPSGRTAPDVAASPQVLRLVYVGTTTHGDDLKLLRPVLENLRSSHGLEVELAVVGGEPPSESASWYRRVHIPSTAYPRFVKWLRSQRANWDIAVAPLADTPFNRSKSDLKFLEYTALGLPGVYSDVLPYSTVEDGVTGLLADNSVESWSLAVARLCTEEALRRGIGEAARRYVLTERCIGHSAEDYLDLLAGLVVDDGARREPAGSRPGLVAVAGGS